MRIGAIIQARMSSRRLPGKVLRRIEGKPLLQFLLERLEHCSHLDRILVATSVHESDTPICDLCRELGIPAFRGSLEDVSGRFLDILTRCPLDGFVRLSADSPLLDQRLVDEGVMLFEEGDYDLVTNVHPRTYPHGESVEVVRSATFRRTYPCMVSDEDREHVTRYFYRNSHNFAIHNFVSETYLGDLHLAVDREEDLDIIRGILGRMTRPHWDYSLAELIKIYRGLQ
jgi:spore coat polysaccharide biosynthesis protein SpsF